MRATIPQAVDPVRVAIHGVECAPGELAEVDSGRMGRMGRMPDPATGRERSLWAFIVVLVHSRHLFVAAVSRMDEETWLRCHLKAFAFFGGTVRRLILDNLKEGVLKADLYDPVLNRSYCDMGRYCDILLAPARNREPTDKPHVERNVPFVRERMTWPLRHNEPRPALTPDHAFVRAFAGVHGTGGSTTGARAGKGWPC